MIQSLPEGLTAFSLYLIVRDWTCSMTVAGKMYVGWSDNRSGAVEDCLASIDRGETLQTRVAERNARLYPQTHLVGPTIAGLDIDL